MLKQVGLTLESSKSIATQTALDTTNEIANQSRTVFEEIKGMVEMVQKKDERGHIRAITVAQRVKWCFKKQRVQYLLGQLESLKEQDMLQERAEIQNMVVVRHWSFVDLRRLYEMAEHEGTDDIKSPIDSAPPGYEAVEHPGGDQRLAIEPSPQDSDQSKAMVKYHETPLNDLDAKMTKAMALPNKVLAQPDVNVVDHLLTEWTRVNEFEKRRQKRRERYGAHYETDDESDTSSDDEYDQSIQKGSRYIDGPNGTQKPRKSVKNVHFRARVESDNEDSDKVKPRNGRAPSRHILRSDSSSSSPSPPPRSRRSSDSSTRFRPAPADLADRTRRPYTQPRDGVSSNDRPTPRNGPGPQPSPKQLPRGLPPQWQNPPQSPHWSQNQMPQSPGLRPPPYSGPFTPPPNGQYQPGHFPPPPPPGPQRMHTSSGPYHTGHPLNNQQKQTSPSSSFQPGFRGPPPSGLDGRPRDGYQRDGGGHHHHSGRHHRRHETGEREREEKKREAKPKSFKENAKKDVTRGLLGAGAVAGLMDLLGGLDGI
ncbi:MAG: hypothetical protein Q9195_002442 [Heterodermia aff. obscurata]